jgi:hypothetical protein
MISNRNVSFKHLDDLMLHRWENEGGCLGPLAMTDRDNHRDDYRDEVREAEMKLTPSAVDRAMSDSTFVKQLARRSCRVGREAHWASAT